MSLFSKALYDPSHSDSHYSTMTIFAASEKQRTWKSSVAFFLYRITKVAQSYMASFAIFGEAVSRMIAEGNGST
jgi:hypothetical protein